MRLFQKFYLNAILWLMPLPAALGWRISCLGDYLLERSGGAAMSALRGLARLESEAV